MGMYDTIACTTSFHFRPHASSLLLTWISVNKEKPGIQKIPQHLKHALEESSAYDHHWDLEEKKKETCFGV